MFEDKLTIDRFLLFKELFSLCGGKVNFSKELVREEIIMCYFTGYFYWIKLELGDEFESYIL